jgi:hypothetical protein
MEDVFAVMTDVEKTAIWVPGNVEEHWTSPPPHRVGSTRHAVVTLCRRFENEVRATEYDPPDRAVMSGTSPNAPIVVALDFRPEGRARVNVTSDLTLRGHLRMLGPVFVALYGRAWTRGLRNLKRMMESGVL